MNDLPVLKSANVELIPFSEPWNKEYLYELMRSYPFDEGVGRDASAGEMFWLGYDSFGVLGGVVYLCYHETVDRWTLDAYRDDKLMRGFREQKRWSEEAGKLICEYFFSLKVCDILYSAVDDRNKLAIKLLERLGFEKTKTDIFLNHNYTLLLKRRE